jgi:acetyl esterase/lipase
MKKLLFFIALITPAYLFAQTETDSSYKPVAYPTGYTAKLNIVYTTVKEWDGKVDFYLPPNTGKPTAIVINIHGGGWNHGVKESQTGFSTFFKEGFAVANIEYRLTGQATAPAAVEDTRCALTFIIKNAKTLNVDVNKIVLMGGSAGGHLALMAGLLGNNNLFDKNCTSTEKIKVAAIIDKYGITDVWDWAYGKNITSKSAKNWLSNFAKDSSFAASVSPIHYVTKNSPPIFIVHGDADPTVPYQQSVDLHKKLLALNIKTEFVTVAGGLHGKFEKEKNTEINKAIIQFLKNLNIP